MAQGLLKEKLPERLKEKVIVESAGTMGLEGLTATRPAIEVAREKGADLAGHRSQGVSLELIEEADVIFAMAREHKEFLEQMFPDYRENVFLLKSFARGAKEAENDSIEDPIGASIEVYRQCIEEIDTELDRILPPLITLIEQKLNGEALRKDE